MKRTDKKNRWRISVMGKRKELIQITENYAVEKNKSKHCHSRLFFQAMSDTDTGLSCYNFIHLKETETRSKTEKQRK